MRPLSSRAQGVCVSKRTADSLERGDAKRLRTSDARVYDVATDVDAFRPSHQRRVADIVSDTEAHDGYLRGRVHMKWSPVDGSLRILMVSDDGHRINVVFTGKCSQYFHLLFFGHGDRLLLSLKGSSLENATSSTPTLKYEHGALIKFIGTKDLARIGQVIDTWHVEQTAQTASARRARASILEDPAQDDWYATQPLPSTSTNPSLDASADTDAPGPQTMSCRPAYCTADTSASIPAIIPVSGPPIPTDSSSNDALPGSASSAGIISSVVASSSASHSSVQQETTSDNSAIDRNQAEVAIPANRSQAQLVEPFKHSSGQQTLQEYGGQVQAANTPLSPDATVRGVRGGDPNPVQLQGVKKTKKILYREEKGKARSRRKQKAFTSSGLLDTDSAVSFGNAIKRADRPQDAEHEIAASVPVSPPPDYQDSQSMLPIIHNVTVIHESLAPRSVILPNQYESKQNFLIQPLPDPVSPPGEPNSPGQPEHAIASTPPPPRPAIVVHSTARSVSFSGEPSEANDNVSLRQGRHTEAGFYTPLKNVTQRKPYNVAGIVQSTSGVTLTKNSEYKITIRLTDPSIYGINLGGFRVHCFAKVQEMLPKPDLHQVLALRYIQGDEFNGESCGSAPSYKDWRAAIFDPRTDAIVSRPSEADTDELLFEPTSSELVLCKRLKEWWATTEAYINPVTVHSVSGDHVPKRIHRLISDVHPDVEPHGFFDCTVEVLYQHESNSGIHTVYLTDYTANPSLGVIERDWTPPQLNNKVMKMELFGDAAAEGANMNPGDYYEFRNAKMRISRGGYWEAKFDDRVDRMQKLSTDELEHYPHLSALLRRKKEWQEQVEACGDEQHFPHALFEQFTRNHHYNCTVEVLSVSANEADPVFLYVTDYTPRNDLVPVDTTHGHWSGLQDRIVKIKLIDEQAKTGKNLQPGDFVLIHNLRLKPSGPEAKLIGHLGGAQRLLRKLIVNDATNVDLAELLRRKEEWKTELRSQRTGRNRLGAGRRIIASIGTRVSSTSVDLPNASFVSAVQKDPTRSTIKEIIESKACPARFRLHARIVDFFPHDLIDFTVRRCTNCGDDISDRLRACTACDDVMDPSSQTFVRAFYQFWFEVEDQEGSRLRISASDPLCNLFNGIEPVDFREDPETFERFIELLKPVLGNLLTVRNGGAQRRLDNLFRAPDTPMMVMDIGNWSLADEHDPCARGYVLIHCDLRT